MALPLLLAGPILRRVDAKIVSVWAALSQHQTVTLRVWQGEITGSGSGLLSTAEDPRFEGATITIQVGANLHIAVVTVTTIQLAPLQPGTFYSYNLIFNNTQDLQSLGLLSDAAGPQPNLALGYQGQRLPPLLLKGDGLGNAGEGALRLGQPQVGQVELRAEQPRLSAGPRRRAGRASSSLPSRRPLPVSARQRGQAIAIDFRQRDNDLGAAAE